MENNIYFKSGDITDILKCNDSEITSDVYIDNIEFKPVNKNEKLKNFCIKTYLIKKENGFDVNLVLFCDNIILAFAKGNYPKEKDSVLNYDNITADDDDFVEEFISLFLSKTTLSLLSSEFSNKTNYKYSFFISHLSNMLILPMIKLYELKKLNVEDVQFDGLDSSTFCAIKAKFLYENDKDSFCSFIDECKISENKNFKRVAEKITCLIDN